MDHDLEPAVARSQLRTVEDMIIISFILGLLLDGFMIRPAKGPAEKSV